MNWIELLGLSGFEDFEQTELAELKQLGKEHRGHVLKTGRRFVAAMLAAAMILPSAAMAAQLLYPPQADRAADGTSIDDPHIEIESNFVHDAYGFLDNTLELAIRVQSPMLDTGMTDVDGDPILVARPVQSVSVNLAYDTELLHPVSWEWVRDERLTTSYDVDTDALHYYDVKLETQKDSRIQTAAATTGIVDTTVQTGYTVSENVADGKQGLLYFTARAFKAEPLEEMTTIAVIRFAVADELMEHIEIKKDKVRNSYTISYDGTEVTDVVGLQGLMTTTLPLVEFAQQKDIEDADGKAVSEGSTLLYYSDEFTQMNYIPDFDPLAPDVEQVKRKIKGTEHTLDRPKTAQSPSRPVDDDWELETLTLAWDETADTYSYTTNLIYKDNVKFTVVSKESFMAPEDILDKLTTIVYVDWDNTIIGTQIVPKKTDVRAMVSDYVAENFIYHDDDDTSYNAQFDLNNPEQIAAAEGTAAEDVVSSLERKYTYRGKYPATGPMGLDSDGNTLHDSPDTVVDEMSDAEKGSAYPLTNKLDYVFFKRPMVHTDQTTKPDKDDPKYSVANDPDGSQYKADYDEWYFAKTEWSQKMVEGDNGTTGGGTTDEPTTIDDGDTGDTGDTGDSGEVTTPIAAEPYWDVEHPYAYGWAQCTVDNYEDVWTTLGMGELGSTDKSTETASLAYQTDTNKGYSGAYDGGYFDLSTSQNTVASVTYDGDAAFAFADLEKGFTDRTVFLKAVYEPGTELLDSAKPYRLYRDPYYNKLNKAAAQGGGAYSIETIYERSTVNDDEVVGVARMRLPAVRQDTTTDMRWESLPSKGVTNDDMISATTEEAYVDKNKTTYAKVDIPNDELITVSLTTSGRQNKVDYYLAETYGANYNFVAHAARSLNDNVRTDGESAVDNYTYYEEGTETAPYHATSRYSERSGTRGFVLYGTLENLMEAATKANNGVITDREFQDNATQANLEDVNICNADGTAIDRGTLSAIRNAIKAAAATAQTAHEAGNDMWWDVEHDHASLTYHQLQHYIISGNLYPDAADELEGDKIAWCRLHEECANMTSAKPTDWPGLISAAKNGQKDNITLLTATQIETYFKLRGPNAALWTADTVSTFADKVIAAVAAGATSWDQVQYYLINDTLDPNADAYGQTHYWWYDDPNGATTYTISNWTDLMGAARDARVEVTLPDDSTGKRTAKLSNVEDAFNANAAAAAASAGGTDPDWVAATENLCVNNNGEPFASFTDFTDALTGALDALEAAGYTSPDWWQVQYVVLGGNAVDALPKSDPNAPTDYVGYWWHNGGAKIVDIPTLIKAGKDGNDAALEMLTAAEITASPFDLRKSFKGEEFTDADMDDFIDKMKNVPYEVNDWPTLQYYLIHDTYEGTEVGRESGYYWWVNGGTGTTVSVRTIDNLIRAAFLATYNGNTASWDALTLAQVKALNLRAPVMVSGEFAEETFDDLPEITDLDTFKADIVALLDKYYADNNITHTHTPPANGTISWYQVQKWLVEKVYDTTTSETDLAKVYWWKDGGNNPTAKSNFEKLLDYLEDYKNTGDRATFDQRITNTFMMAKGNEFRFTANNPNIAPAQMGAVRNRLIQMLGKMPAGMEVKDLTWANIQYAILSPAGNYGSAYYSWNPTLTGYEHLLGSMATYQKAGYTGTALSERVTAANMMAEGFRFMAANPNIAPAQVSPIMQRLTNMMKNGSGTAASPVPLTEAEILSLKWGQVQYAILRNGAYTTDPAQYDNYSWDPTKATASMANLFMLNNMAYSSLATVKPEDITANTDPTTKTVVSEDEKTTTVTTTRREFDEEKNILTLIITDVTTVIDGNRKVVTTVERVLVIDLLTGQSTEAVGAPTTEVFENKIEEEKKPEENKPETDNKPESDKKDDVYTITPDTEIKKPEESTGSSDADVAHDDNDNQVSSQPAKEPEGAEEEVTAPAEEKAEADSSVQTAPEEPDADTDDEHSQAAVDPPLTGDALSTAHLLESVTDLRTIREGPTRFRASPQRSPWIRFPVLELLPTLTNRRITA